jgi:antibiotic biosynthesis monooxygenase (ABM) superfamily enzyme
LSRTNDFSDQHFTVDYHSLEFWFSPEKHQGRAPGKHKMALVTFFALWPLVHFIPQWTNRLSDVSLIGEVTSLATIVLLMTYLVMPAVTRLLSPWLFAKPD